MLPHPSDDYASGDGFGYRGRGLLQVTGRESYRRVGFENNPDALSDPVNAATSGAKDWNTYRMNGQSLNQVTSHAVDKATFREVTHKINGGYTQAAERWTAYQRALHALGVSR